MHQQKGDKFEFSYCFYGFKVMTFNWKAATFWFSCTNFSFPVNFLFKGFDQGLEVKEPTSHQMLPSFRIVEGKTTIFFLCLVSVRHVFIDMHTLNSSRKPSQESYYDNRGKQYSTTPVKHNIMKYLKPGAWKWWTCCNVFLRISCLSWSPCWPSNHYSIVMVNILVPTIVDCEFEPWSYQTKDY